MESEVRKIFFELQEIVEIEHFIERACAVEIVHHAVGSLESLRHMHYLRAQRSHTRTAAYPHHLGFAVENGMEVAIRTAHPHLVARFESEYVAGCNTRHYVHEAEKDFPNFRFHLALDRPDPAADAAGVKYTPGFVHQVIYDTYLKDHPAPEDIEYYMCGPGPMSNAVNGMLDSLGVEPSSIHYDNFGG